MQRRSFTMGVIFALPAMVYPRITALAVGTERAFRVGLGEARGGTRYSMKGVTLNTLDLKISGADTDGVMSVFEQTGHTPNGGPPLHIHIDQDEWFFVTEGEYEFQCGTDRFRLKAGDTIFLPRNVPHAFVQLTEHARTIVSYLPSGKMEEFFAVTDKWTSPPSTEIVKNVFADHGMKVVGPPITAQLHE